MKIRFAVISVSLAVSLVCAGCKTTPEKEKTSTAAKTPPKPPNMADQSGDVAFQSFLTRLRGAIKQHDVQTLAGMMTTDFGYRLDPIGEGAGVFEYWDQSNIWPELELVINERFVPNGNYMVAPPEFALPNSQYSGYRAGIKIENGSWKFAYFVSGQ